MDAISPFSFADKLKPTEALSAGLNRLAGMPDHTVGHRIVDAAVAGFSHAMDEFARSDALTNGQTPAAESGPSPGNPKNALHFVGFALERAAQLDAFFAGAPPALPGPPASRAPENLPGMQQIRDAYDVITRLH